MEKKETLELLTQVFKLELINKFKLLEDCIIINLANGDTAKIKLEQK